MARADFLGDVGSSVQGAGQAVAGGVQQAGAELQQLPGEALRAAGDKALQASGRCGYLWSNKAKVSQALTPRLATGFQESGEDPSVDIAACERVGTAKTLALMHQYWTDVSGLSDQLAAGLLNGGITASVCAPALMQTLKAEEPIRQSKPDVYVAALHTTLHDQVFTDAWVKKLFSGHCGEEPVVTRLFELPGQVVEDLWTRAPTRASVLACVLSMWTVSGVALLLLVARGRHMQRGGSEDMHAEELMLLESVTEDAGMA